MDESGSGSTINLSKDPAWKYCEIVNNNRNETKCNFCSSVFKGGAHRAKQHLAGGYRNAKDCKNVPPHVREEIQNYMSKKKVEKASSMRGVFDDFEVNDVELEGGASGTKDSTSIHSFVSSYKGNKRKRQGQGLIDKFVQRTDQASHKGKERQTTINEAYKKEMREKSCKSIAKWMYDAAIPFNAVNYPSFQEMIDDISRHGPGLKAPTYHEIRVPYLKKVVDDVENDYVKICQEEWVQYGCSLMMDGWTDRRQRTLINFLVNSPNGSVFIESIDASDYAKTGQRMFELMDKFVDRIGEENVVQIITDNASNMKLAGQLLMEKRKHLYWTPCAAHCIDLILEDIGKLSEFKSTLKKATSVTSFIYVRPGVVNMLRQFTGNMELCRAGVTRFAAAFLTLQRMYSLKPKLRSMLASKEWAESKWSKESEGKKVFKIILSSRFWNSVLYNIKIYGPLVQVLRLVDGEKNPAMGYIYEAMDRAKESIIKAFPNHAERYEKIFEIIDERWNCQLHQPLHAAAYMLNPQFFYERRGSGLGEIGDGFVATVERLVRGEENQMQTTMELDSYRRATNAFGSNLAIKQRATMSPVAWWHTFGSSTPNLQKFAIKVLSLTCSSSGCERNWSIFENVHSKRRNRLEQQRMNDLVYVKYNRALQRRYHTHDTVDPISLKEIDDCNEWLTGIVDEDAGDELVFKGDTLTWDVVEKAMGIGELAYYTRKKKSKADTASTSSATPTSIKRKDQMDKGKRNDQLDKGKRVKASSLRLVDEDLDIEVDLECDVNEEEEFNEKDDQFEEEEEDEE